MGQSLILKCRGLYTSFNELSAVPEGALEQADNIDVVENDIAEPRRGNERFSGELTVGTTPRASKMWFYEDQCFAHHGDEGSPTKVGRVNGANWTDLTSSYSSPTGFKMRAAFAGENCLFTSSTGVKKLAAYTDTDAIAAGAPKGLDIDLSTTGSSGFLTDQYRVAYRILWAYRDSNNNLIVGAPSQRVSIKNTAGSAATRNVSITATVPAGVVNTASQVTWLYQIYRSEQVDNTSLSTEPSDEMQLVYEGTYSSGSTITVTDITPDELRGEFIYTASTQQGLANGNEQPPLARDVVIFRECAFYLNTISKHRYYLTLLSVDSSAGGLESSTPDTITIGGVVFTAAASEDAAAGEFAVSAGSSSTNIRDTALSLTRVINRYASSTVYAYYLSGPDDLPGQILIEERAVGGSSFAVVSSRSACWSPALPSSGTSESSSNDERKNGGYFSKPNEYEAVPLPNTLVGAGSETEQIRKAWPLQDALLLLKDDGVYRVTGDYPSFDVDLLDSSAKIIGPETAAILNNEVYALSDQGVVAISNGVKVISRPIEGDLLELLAEDLDSVKSLAFGVGYETDRKYMLFLPTAPSSDSYCKQAYVFNSFTGAWTRHILNAHCGIEFEKKLYLGDGASAYVLRDRKNYTFLDYADYGFSTTITDVTDTTITLSGSSDLINVGDILYQSSTVFATVTAVDTITQQVTISTDPGFTAAATDVLKAITATIKWVPVTGGNPGILKHWNTCTLMFKADYRGTGYLKFSTDLSQFDESVPVEGSGQGLWGLFPWGEEPWGGVARKKPTRQWIPREKQVSSLLSITFEHSYGFSPWKLQGVTVFGEEGGEAVNR